VMLDVPSATDFTRLDGVSLARLAGGPATVQQAVAAITRILASAAEAGVDRLVIDGTSLHDVATPSLADRHAMVRAWAAAAAGRVVVALACPPELIDPERFGVVAATSFGLRSNVFANVHEAVEWLRLQ
jgi:hypothetical protein